MALGKNIKVDKLIPDNAINDDVNTLQEEVTLNKLSGNLSEEESKDEEKNTATEEFNEGLKFIVEPSRRKSVKKAKIFIEGKLEVNNAEFLTEKIKEVITSYNIIDFKLRNIEDLDLSSIQILYYFTNVYNKGKKTIIFHIEDLPIALKTLLVKTKYNKILFKKPLTPTK